MNDPTNINDLDSINTRKSTSFRYDKLRKTKMNDPTNINDLDSINTRKLHRLTSAAGLPRIHNTLR